jgi:hypothetical protein
MRPRLSTRSSTSEISCDQLQSIVEKVDNSAASMRKELKRVASQRSRRLGCAAQPKLAPHLPRNLGQGTLVPRLALHNGNPGARNRLAPQ